LFAIYIEIKIGNHNYQLIECDEYEMDERHANHVAHLISLIKKILKFYSRKIAAAEICSFDFA